MVVKRRRGEMIVGIDDCESTPTKPSVKMKAQDGDGLLTEFNRSLITGIKMKEAVFICKFGFHPNIVFLKPGTGITTLAGYKVIETDGIEECTVGYIQE